MKRGFIPSTVTCRQCAVSLRRFTKDRIVSKCPLVMWANGPNHNFWPSTNAVPCTMGAVKPVAAISIIWLSCAV